MMNAAERLRAELGEDEPKPKQKKQNGSTSSNGKGLFTLANGVDTARLLDWLCIEHRTWNNGKEYAVCPGCKNDGALVGENGGLKCFHDTCKDAGPSPEFRGFRSPVDLVALVKQLEPSEAAKAICKHFGIEVAERKRNEPELSEPPPGYDVDEEWIPPADDASEPEPEPVESPPEPPTPTDPLRGLTHLSKVALLGRDRILELARTPIDYIWQDIAVAGTIVLIAGPPAEGKTTLLFLVLVARATMGEPVALLGRQIEPAPEGKYIVLIEGEHSEASTSRKLVKSLALMDIEDGALDRIIIVARKSVTIGSVEWLDVTQMISAGLVSDIGIDTLARVAPADADKEREQVAIFNAVAMAIELAPKGQAAPVVWTVSHTRKNGTTGELADVAGSVQRTGQADTVMLAKGEKVEGRTVSTKVTFLKLREDPDEYPLPVTYSIMTEAGITAIRYHDKENDQRPLEQRILDELRSGPRTKNALARALTRSAKDIDTAITNLFSAKAIRTTSVKVRGMDRKAFEIRERPWSADSEIEDLADDLSEDFEDGGVL